MYTVLFGEQPTQCILHIKKVVTDPLSLIFFLSLFKENPIMIGLGQSASSKYIHQSGTAHDWLFHCFLHSYDGSTGLSISLQARLYLPVFTIWKTFLNSLLLLASGKTWLALGYIFRDYQHFIQEIARTVSTSSN